MKIGQEYPVKVYLDLKDLSSKEIGLELVITENDDIKPVRIIETVELFIKIDGNSGAGYCIIDVLWLVDTATSNCLDNTQTDC